MSKEIKVGEYIRTHIGIIGKVININDFRPPETRYAVESRCNDDILFVGDEHIKIHSSDIINLLEER